MKDVTSKKVRECSKCSSAMELGFVPLQNFCWAEGFFPKGLVQGFKQFIKFDMGKKIEAWRCPACGIVEFYTSKELQP